MRFPLAKRDGYAETVREKLLLECDALLSDEPERFAGPLDELGRQLVGLLVPQSLSPADPSNALLQIERAYQDGVAELERAGHGGREWSVYEYLHRLKKLEQREKQPASQY